MLIYTGQYAKPSLVKHSISKLNHKSLNLYREDRAADLKNTQISNLIYIWKTVGVHKSADDLPGISMNIYVWLINVPNLNNKRRQHRQTSLCFL